MKFVLSLSLLSACAVALPHQRQRQGGNRPGNSSGCNASKELERNTAKALYLMTNDAENAVVALPVGNNGMISAGTVTKTGGAGSNAIDGATMQAAVPDALVSQSALTVVGQNVFAVNAGSNTLTMMGISQDDPTRLTMIGQPIPIPGEFPSTVAASAKNNLVCVGSTGAKAGISCANFSPEQGLGQMDSLRPFDIGQSTPPVGPTNTVSHTFFSADETALLTTVKGDPAVNNTGFLSVFPIEGTGRRACLSTKETRSSPAGTAVLFGSATIPNNPSTLFVTDASFGAAILSLNGGGEASLVKAQPIEGQAATCWATVSDMTKSAFVTDVAMNRVVEMSLDDAGIIGQLDLSTNGDPGLIDLRAAGNFVYALSPGNGTTDAAVTILDISGGQGSMKQLQHFELSGLAGKNSMGMAVLL